MTTLQSLMQVPAIHELFTVRSPLDLVGIGFFGLILYTVVGGTVSMVYHQGRYIYHAIARRTAPALGELHPYTKSLIAGTSPELRSLRSTRSRARRREILAGIINTLEVQDSSTVARALVKSLRARF